MKTPKYILPIIVIAQFFCTSLWFAGNAVMNGLIADFLLEQNSLSLLTSAVQFGFIIGTLIFAIFTIGDQFSPSTVFATSAILGALTNVLCVFEFNTLLSLILLRFLTGFFLAGIYPIGMKIAADYFDKELGKSLGFLVGALVLGTAFPHAINEVAGSIDWRYVLITTSTIATIGGGLIGKLVPDGPFRKEGQQLKIKELFRPFTNPKFKAAAFGYFGHMWELYTFWAFVPLLIQFYASQHYKIGLSVSLLSFIVIGIGSLGCIVGGYLSQKFGSKRTATIALLISGCCCLLSPLFFHQSSVIVFVIFLLIWGITVIADSPLFSTLVAQNAPPEIKATALTIVNSIGFSLTIISIQFFDFMRSYLDFQYIYILLVLGPVFGLIALLKKQKHV